MTGDYSALVVAVLCETWREIGPFTRENRAEAIARVSGRVRAIREGVADPPDEPPNVAPDAKVEDWWTL